MTFFIQLKQTLPAKLHQLSATESTRTKVYINTTLTSKRKACIELVMGCMLLVKCLHQLTANELTIVCPELSSSHCQSPIEVHKFQSFYTQHYILQCRVF